MSMSCGFNFSWRIENVGFKSKKEEKIRIGQNIVITIVEVRGNIVRIGIDAPKEMKIVRTEIDPNRCAST